MTKDVIIGISGLQFTGESGADSLEMIAPGEYFLRNGRHYVKYEEVIEGFAERNQNLVKISPNKLEVTKKGLTNIHMVFEENKKNITYYNTPFGNLFIGIDAEKIQVEESEENINVNVAYALEANYEHLADCRIQMNIKSKDARDFKLQA